MIEQMTEQITTNMAEIELPASWKDWTICEEIGSGRNGRVYLARNQAGELSAIKVIPGYSQLPREELLAKLEKCPNVVRIYDTAYERGCSYIRMEYLDSFTDRNQEMPMSEAEMIRCMLQICQALEYMEANHILHRDIKPQNILMRDDSCVLCDIDQARTFTPDESSMSIQGSFSYMAPEMYYGKKYDHRADMYSLGMVFYRCCNRGRLPFSDMGKRLINHKDMENALEMRMKGKPLPAPADASPEFADILLRMCDPDPARRFAGAGELTDALERLQRGKYHVKKNCFRSWSRRRRWAVGILAAAAIACIIGSVGYAAWLRTPLISERAWTEGSTISYTIDHAGTAVFRGEGDVEEIYDNTEWAANRSLIRKLVIGKGIRSFAPSFCDAGNLEELILEDGVESLAGFGQFTGCKSLRQVSLPDSLLSIGECAFRSCSALQEIRLPEKMTVIPAETFYDCSNLRQIDITGEIRQIGSYAFYGTAWLEDLRSREGLVLVNGILIAARENDSELILPADCGIRSIAAAAFQGADWLRSIQLPEGLEEIGEGSFAGCPNLNRVILPESLQTIGKEAFSSCPALGELQVPETADVSAGDIFSDTPFLDSITDAEGFAVVNHTLLAYRGNEAELSIPASADIHTIGRYAFWTNDTLVSVDIPEGVTDIEDMAFFMCRNLERVSLPDSIQRIGGAAFAGALWQPQQ